MLSRHRQRLLGHVPGSSPYVRPLDFDVSPGVIALSPEMHCPSESTQALYVYPQLGLRHDSAHARELLATAARFNGFIAV